MILPVYLYGQPVLRKEAEEVPMDYPDLKQLVANMFETMYNADGVGLAAPQVGLSLRLLVIDADVMGDDFPECKGFFFRKENLPILLLRKVHYRQAASPFQTSGSFCKETELFFFPGFPGCTHGSYLDTHMEAPSL